MHLRRLWLLALVLCFLGAAPTWSEAGKKKRLGREARAHVKAGLAHLDKGEHDRAIESLKIAYSLSEQASILFDIGRAYEAKQDRAQAIYYYSTFLEQARRDRRKRTDAQKRIERLEAEADATGTEPRAGPEPEPPPEAEPHAPPPPPPVTVEEPRPAPAPVAAVQAGPEPRGGGRGLRIAGVVTFAAGVVGLGAGGYFAWVAHDRSRQITDLFEGGATWDPRYDDLYDEGRDSQRNARILLGVGGAAAVTGVVLYMLGRPSGGGVEVSAGAGGAEMSWSCAW